MASQGSAPTLVYYAYNTSTGAYVTGDVANHTLKLVKDGTEASPTNAASEVDSVNMPGAYKVLLTTAETAFNAVTLGGKSSTANVIIIPITMSFELLPTTLTSSSASLLTSGTGTDQLSVSAGKVLLQATQTGVTIPTVTTVTNQLTAAAIASGVWKDTTAGDFTVASSIGKSLYTTGNAPGAASGLAIVGSNMGTVSSVTGSVGSVTGAVGSVSGNIGGNVVGSVASVTGAVGSVTGNVGGNVVGSVASVTGAVGSVTGNVGGNVAGSVASVTNPVAITSNRKKGASATIVFPMFDSTTGALKSGLTVTTTISKDEAAYASTTNTASEIGTSGTYSLALTATEMTANLDMLTATATGATTYVERILTQP